jgi:hypothetical protein
MVYWEFLLRDIAEFSEVDGRLPRGEIVGGLNSVFVSFRPVKGSNRKKNELWETYILYIGYPIA